MKLTDYVIEFLALQGVDKVFGLTGGAVVHLFDSIDKNQNIYPVFTHHEQAAAFSAVSYARIKNSIGVVIVTTGPGGTNAVTGVAAAWLDSIPCVFISGQSRKEHTSRGKPIRQVGSQELDIISIVSSITKYAAMVEEPGRIRYHLEKAVYFAKEGRPGPVWIDIPLDFQWATVEPSTLACFSPAKAVAKTHSLDVVTESTKRCYDFLSKSERPMILAGHGIRLANAEKEFSQLIEILQCPFISTWNSSDLLPTEHDLYVGRPGIFGQRGANLAIQNCDLLLCIGSHLSIPITGTMFHAFAREAKVIMVDIDQAELAHRTVQIDLPIHCDAKVFLQEMLRLCRDVYLRNIDMWQARCRDYKSRYNKISHEISEQNEYVDPYIFVDVLSDELGKSTVIVIDGGGTINQIAFQSFRVREGQRLIISAGLCSMGSGLPESIGACFAGDHNNVICLCGDGSFQLNIQELQTIVHHNLPVKIFVFNNDGYLAIRHTQSGFLDDNYVGSDENGGMSLPDIVKVSRAYGVKVLRIVNHDELFENIKLVLEQDGPVVCEVMVSKKQQGIPRQGFDKRSDGSSSPRPLEDMYPYLSRDEFFENMIVKPLT